VAAALKQLWAQAKFGSKKVVVGVANQKVVVRQVDLPWMPLGDLRTSLPFQVQDYIPMPVDQAILDFHPLEEFASDTGARMLRVLLVAASRDMVDSALLAVQKAGLQPSMVDLTSFAVLRSLYAPSALGAVEAEALVDIGASVTNIVVHQGGVPRFVRILLMGGGDITDAVAERLGVHRAGRVVKQTTGLRRARPGRGAPGEPRHRADRAAPSSRRCAARSTTTRAAGRARIGKVVLSGGGSRLAGLVERLSGATRLPGRGRPPMSLLKLGKTGLTEEQLAYVEPMVSVPVGLALGVSS
jgi:type IV pilus assembly protein PilM